MPIGIDDVANEALLKRVWRKEVRPELRSMTFNNFNYAVDPLHYAAYEWGLDAIVSVLAREIKLGGYSPERGEIVRAAKVSGLTRPLCFLATRDALVYRTITWLAKAQLVADAEQWVGFEHADKGNKNSPLIDESGESFDWFRFWLARQGALLSLIDDDSITHIVESDIANFYPSVSLAAIREHLHSQTELRKEVVRLCVQIIDGVMPRSDYSEESSLGLPQEQIGSSRPIAHSLLLHVDREFENEGKAGRYTRYMDDVLIGVESETSGKVAIGRLQRSLEALGLYPNAAKTHVTAKADYLLDYMVEVNGELERLSSLFQKQSTSDVPHRTVPTPDQCAELDSIAQALRAMSTRPKRWSRVARRIYTLKRDIDSNDWLENWEDDLRADPGAAAVILEYVRAWPLNSSRLTTLVSLSEEFSRLYFDIPILIAEVVATVPISDDKALWSRAFKRSFGEFQRLAAIGRRNPAYERPAAAWLLSAWKFANSAQRQRLLDELRQDLDAASPVRSQALPLFVAEGRSISDWVAAKPGLAWDVALGVEYLRRLEAGEDRAAGVALDLLRPALRLTPQRFIVLPRTLPLLEILGRSASAKLGLAAPKALRDLRRNSDRLRDRRVETLIEQWCP